MMKKFLSGVLVTALVLGTVSFATPATEAEAAVSVPKATYTFNMNGKNSKVVAAGRSGDNASLATGGKINVPTEAQAKKIKATLKYVKGHNGKALSLDRTKSYGAQLKGVQLGKGNQTISFWIQVPSGIGDFNSMFFMTNKTLNDKTQNWISITKGGADWPNTGTPTIWSHDFVNGKEAGFPWYNKNGVNKKGEAVWEAGDAVGDKKWHHIVLVIQTTGKSKNVWYGEKGEAGAYQGYHGYTYVDGKLWGNGAISKRALSTNNLYFLGINAWDTPVKALYDDVMLWKGKALTGKQVKALYNKQK